MQIFINLVESLNSPVYSAWPCMIKSVAPLWWQHWQTESRQIRTWITFKVFKIQFCEISPISKFSEHLTFQNFHYLVVHHRTNGADILTVIYIAETRTVILQKWVKNGAIFEWIILFCECFHRRSFQQVNWNTHTHPFNGPFPGLPGWAGTRKVKPIWILLKHETVAVASAGSYASLHLAPDR